MKYFKHLLLICLVATGFTAAAQNKPATGFKPPKLVTQIAGHRDSVTITVAEAEQLLGAGLKIFDDKKTAYAVSSYQFVYRKIGVTEDEPMGKVTPTFTMTASTFKITPLPANWIQSLREQVKPGDELWFVGVIAKDAQGRVMYAPDVKLAIIK